MAVGAREDVRAVTKGWTPRGMEDCRERRHREFVEQGVECVRHEAASLKLTSKLYLAWIDGEVN